MGFHQLATRAQALAMKAIGATLQHIERITEIKRRTLQYIFKKARGRGWDPSSRPLILDGYIIDAPRTRSKVKISVVFNILACKSTQKNLGLGTPKKNP
jgi:hypothetical protein